MPGWSIAACISPRNLIRLGEPLSAVASRCGFSDQSHLTRLFKARLGVRPANIAR